MANRRFEMFEYRQVLARMRLGDTDRAIARVGLMGRRKVAQLRRTAEAAGWLDVATPLPGDPELAVHLGSVRTQPAVTSLDLKISQKSAWFMVHRIREAWMPKVGDGTPFEGPVEADETYMGGKRKNMSNAKRAELADTVRGAVGKVAVVGVKDRDTNHVAAQVVPDTTKATLQGFVTDHIAPGAKVYTDEASTYDGLANHESVKHSVAEYVRDHAHTNGVESFWSMLKRAHTGTFHKMSPKHLDRYVQEFAGKHNVRDSDTLDQMREVVTRLMGRTLGYRRLVRDNGLSSGARS